MTCSTKSRKLTHCQVDVWGCGGAFRPLFLPVRSTGVSDAELKYSNSNLLEIAEIEMLTSRFFSATSISTRSQGGGKTVGDICRLRVFSFCPV